jgi:hypothetical protein
MKRFLVFVSLVGAATYVFAPSLTAPEEGSTPASAKHHVGGPLLTSWGPTLRSLRQEPEVLLATSHETASSRQTDYKSRPHQELDPQRVASAYKLTPSVDRGSALHRDGSEGERLMAGPAAEFQASATQSELSQSAEPLPPVVTKSKPRKPSPALGPVRLSEGVEIAGASSRPAAQLGHSRRGGFFGLFRARKVERSAWSVGH